MESKEFGQYLRKLRKDKKLTVRQLDLYSSVSHSYISQMERGSRGIPSPDILQKLSRPLGVEYEELMKKAGYIEENKDSKRQAAEKLLEYLELELTNEEIKERMTFKVDNLILSDEEMDEFISFVRWQRSKKKEQPAASKSDEP